MPVLDQAELGQADLLAEVLSLRGLLDQSQPLAEPVDQAALARALAERAQRLHF